MRCIILLFFTFSLFKCITIDKIGENNVQPGANQLNEYLPLISGKSIGIVANKGSLINERHLIDTLVSLESVNIKTVFSPEHGFTGNYEDGRIIENEEQFAGIIEIKSLYGSSRKPSKEDLQDIEVMIFDLQDVGARFYTYISTLHYVMQACAESNIPLIVLDRPNPHCNYIDGPVLKEQYKSFIGMHEVPVVYGMTIGEYALMINGQNWLGKDLKCNLNIIQINNFSRNSYYEFPEKPSPNLPNMRSVYLYPSLCFLEGTVMSVGRGTDYPFQIIGHPDFNHNEISFTPVSIPGASLNPKHKDIVCFGKDYRELELNELRKRAKIDIEILIESYNNLSIGEDFFTNYFELLAGTDQLRKDVIAGKSSKEIRDSWNKELIEFEKIRAKYLIYE